MLGCLNNTCLSQAVFVNFQTQTHIDTIEVSWITQSETNVDYFILQRTFIGNGIFSDIDTINAVGNSTTNQFYSHHDIPPIVDTCYLYRLKVVETNGQFAFSSIVIGCVFIPTSVIEFGNETKTNIYQNPSSGYFVFKGSKIIDRGIIQVLNSIGENIYKREIVNESTFEISLKNISSGIYFLKVFDGVKYYCKRLIVEHN